MLRITRVANGVVVFKLSGGAVMPPPLPRGEGPWPQSRIELFAKWMADGYQP